MTNSLALFVTHHVFLTEDQISGVASGSAACCDGHCVPVWVDAKTGRTSEPANELFCAYRVFNSPDRSGDVECEEGVGFSVWIPRPAEWKPPKEIDFGELASWDEARRAEFLKERDAWWLANPRPMDVQNLVSGYLRFEVKKKDLKVGRRKYSVQHVVEISSVSRLVGSLTA